MRLSFFFRRKQAVTAAINVSKSTASVVGSLPRGLDLQNRIRSHKLIISIVVATERSEEEKHIGSWTHRINAAAAATQASEHWKIDSPHSHPTPPYLGARHVVCQTQAIAEQLGNGKSRGVPGHPVGKRGNCVSSRRAKKRKVFFFGGGLFFFSFDPYFSF